MIMHKDITVDRIMAAAHEDDNIGFCVNCGEEVSGVEPDARKYQCESCGEDEVYGAEELLLELSC
jgi:predicted RNA-binding Zn-ribbon protein involved in translation (DUF1610 family)